MIAKVLTKTGAAQNTSDFGDLSAYIGHEAKAIATRKSDTVVSLQTAGREMQHVARFSESRIENPAYHYVLSWPGTDVLTNEQIFDAVHGSLTAIGFRHDHMWIAAIHGDSDYQHVHVVVNRIHPTTRAAFRPHLDHRKLSRFCREQERLHGWTIGGGLYAVDKETGEITATRSPSAAPQRPLNQRAIDSESWTGIMSFQRWVGTAPADAIRDALESMPRTWSTIHAVLADFDLEYAPRRGGAMVADRSHPNYRAKASHLGTEFSLPKLEKILGRYQPPRNRYLRSDELTYTTAKEAGRLRLAMLVDPRISKLYAQYASLVEEWRTGGRQARAEAAAEVRQRTAERLREHRRQRRELLAAVDGESFPLPDGLGEIPTRLVRQTVVESLDEILAEIRRTNKEERAAMVSRHRAPPELFRSWLKMQADANDPDARAALLLLRTGVVTGTANDVLKPIEQQPPETRFGPADLQGEDSMGVLDDLDEEILAVTEAQEEIGGFISPDRGYDRQPQVDQMTREMDELGGRIFGKEAPEPEQAFVNKAHGVYSQQYLEYLGGQKIPRVLWSDQVERERKRLTQIHSDMRDKFRALKEDQNLGKEDRQARRSLAQMEAAIAVNDLNQTIRHERLMLHHLQSQHRAPSFEEFLRNRAQNEPQAKAVLDLIAEEPQFNDRGYNADASSIPMVEVPTAAVRGIASQIAEDGSVTYTLQGGQQFHDQGQDISVPTNDARAIQVALMLAREKWVDGITVGGSKQFQLLVVREAARLGIVVTNPEHKQLYEKLVAEYDERKKQHEEAYAKQFEAAEAVKLTFHDTAEAHHKAYAHARQIAAMGVAAEMGLQVNGIAPRPDGLEGTVRAAWVTDDQGYVIVETRSAGARLVQTTPEQAEIAQTAYQQSVKIATRDGVHTVDLEPAKTRERTQ